MRNEAEEVAREFSFVLCSMSLRTASDEDECSDSTQKDADDFLAGDGFVQKQRCQNHRDDRHGGCHYTRIYGRSDGESDGVAALIEHDAEHAGKEK